MSEQERKTCWNSPSVTFPSSAKHGPTDVEGTGAPHKFADESIASNRSSGCVLPSFDTERRSIGLFVALATILIRLLIVVSVVYWPSQSMRMKNLWRSRMEAGRSGSPSIITSHRLSTHSTHTEARHSLQPQTRHCSHDLQGWVTKLHLGCRLRFTWLKKKHTRKISRLRLRPNWFIITMQSLVRSQPVACCLDEIWRSLLNLSHPLFGVPLLRFDANTRSYKYDDQAATRLRPNRLIITITSPRNLRGCAALKVSSVCVWCYVFGTTFTLDSNQLKRCFVVCCGMLLFCVLRCFPKRQHRNHSEKRQNVHFVAWTQTMQILIVLARRCWMPVRQINRNIQQNLLFSATTITCFVFSGANFLSGHYN